MLCAFIRFFFDCGRLRLIAISQLFIILLASGVNAFSSNTNGRITVGGFVSKERQQPTPTDDGTNDFAIASARFFLSHETEDKEYVFDIRDKNDFFNKLDKERQVLTAKNTLQVRQASVRYTRENTKLFGAIGRFPIMQAGTAYTDGAELGYHLSSSLKTAVFGGYNPRRDDRSYLEFNEKAQNYGVYLDYSPKIRSWSKKYYLANAFVQQTYDGQVDRRYFYHNSIFQWSNTSFLSNLVYLDFVPRTYIQSAMVNYSQALTPYTRGLFTLSHIDVIQYRREQDLREKLDPSVFNEVGASIKSKVASKLYWGGRVRYGKREADKLSRTIYSMSFDVPSVGSKRIALFAEASHRDDFTKTGDFAKVGSGYYSDFTEYEVSLEAGIEKNNDNSTRHPIIADASMGLQYSKKIFVVFSGQYIHDEVSQIITGFAKLSYRFGDKGIAPLRDGAPPRGRQLF